MTADFFTYIRRTIDLFERATARHLTPEWRLLIHEADYYPFLKALTEEDLLLHYNQFTGRLFGIPLCRTAHEVEIVPGYPEDIRGHVLIIPPEEVERLGLKGTADDR
jgi:hypothetical protein